MAINLTHRPDLEERIERLAALFASTAGGGRPR